MSSCISHRSKAFLVVMKVYMLFSECSEEDGWLACEEFVDSACEGYRFVVDDNCEDATMPLVDYSLRPKMIVLPLEIS